jgi:NAD(P)-dependent dehydrogenase (short-subunit alcohol dehydrogenase family)
MEKLNFEDRVVVITGAGNGLGRAYAHEFARRGAKIVVNDLGTSTDGSGTSNSAAEKVVEEVRKLGGEAVASFDSVASVEGGLAIIKTAIDTWGRIDALVSNAGILRDKSFLKLSPEDFKAVLDVHLFGAFNVSQPAFRAMKDQGQGGRILLTSSAVALFGNFGQANYVAAKMGIVGLTTSLAIEGNKSNILANCIAPMASTRLTRKVFIDDPADARAPHRVAPLAVFLCHPQSSANGQVFVAGNNYFARSAMLVGEGWVAAEGDANLTVEGVAQNWGKIESISSPRELKSGYEIVEVLKAKVPYLAGN